MDQNYLFQAGVTQNSGPNNLNWIAQTPFPTAQPSRQQIPVRVVFSPDQISPQEIPTNGTPALFPLSDGSKIIAMSYLPNGRYDDQIYVLQPKNQAPNINQNTEFNQIMGRLASIEDSLGKVLGDLYGSEKKEEGTIKDE